MWKNSREQFESNESGCKGVARPVGRSKKRQNMETRIDGLVDAIEVVVKAVGKVPLEAHCQGNVLEL